MQVPPSTTPSAKGLEPTGPVRQLSIDEAVSLALEQNLGIQIERFNPELQDLNTAQILSNYVPRFGAGVFTQSQDQPPSSFLSGGDDTISLRQLRVHDERREAVPVGHRSDRGLRQRPAD